MTSDEKGYLLAFIALGVIIAFFVIVKHLTAKEKERLERKRELKDAYETALKATDKGKALRLGREYYGSLREDGRVTTYDEQAITNDINSMTNTVNVVNTVIHKVEKDESKSNSSASNQKTLYCSKCGKAYVPNMNKLFCEECGNKY